jgi:hypothetical protein
MRHENQGAMVCRGGGGVDGGLGISGCGKSKAGGGDSGESTEKLSPIEEEAQKAALTAISRHWVNGPDGWTTARMEGSPYAPEHFLRQVHEIQVDRVVEQGLVEGDKLSGLEWAGRVELKKVSCREAGDPGMLMDGTGDVTVDRVRGRWTQWAGIQPDSIRVSKQRGQWHVVSDTCLLRGTIPTPADYANAGVK